MLRDIKPVQGVRQDFLSLSLSLFLGAALLWGVCSPIVGVKALRVKLYQALTPLNVCSAPWWGRLPKEVRSMFSQRTYASPV